MSFKKYLLSTFKINLSDSKDKVAALILIIGITLSLVAIGINLVYSINNEYFNFKNLFVSTLIISGLYGIIFKRIFIFGDFGANIEKDRSALFYGIFYLLVGLVLTAVIN